MALAGRARLNYRVDILALAAATVVFATGLLLLLRFHVAHGSLNNAAFGLSRLAWMNIHRTAAVLVFAGVITHLALHWRTFTAKVSRTLKRRPGKASRADVVLYVTFALVSTAASVAWVALPGSPKRHFWIDLHNFSGLTLLAAVVIHVRRHLSWLLRSTGRTNTIANGRLSN